MVSFLILLQLVLVPGARAIPAAGARPAAAADPVVVVVGAGAAGLAAVHELEKRGIPAVLYTDEARLGGRIRGFTRGGLTTNAGAELVNKDDTHLIALAREFGLKLIPHSASGPDTRSDDFLHDGQVLRTAEVYARALRESRPAIERLARDDRALALAQESKDPRESPLIRKLDHQSITDYLGECGAGPLLRAYLTAAMTSESGMSAGQQSALALLDYFDFDAGAAAPFRLTYWEQEGYRIEGGMHRLIEGLVRTQKSPIHTGHELVAVRTRRAPGRRAAAVPGLELDFRTASRIVTVAASRAIIAIPLTRLRLVDLTGVRALSPAARELIAHASYGSHAKLVLQFDRRVWNDQKHSGTLLSSSNYQLWDSSVGEAGPAGSLTAFLGAVAPGLTREVALATVLPEIERAFPRLRRHLTGAELYTWPVSYSARYGLGEFTRLSPFRLDPVGALAFAGEHLSEDKWAYVEGALETGVRAAEYQARGAGAAGRAAGGTAALRQHQPVLVGPQVR